MAWRSGSILALVLLLALTATSPAAAKRFRGTVGGVATGPGHSFFIGDGLHLTFRDTRKAHTRYKVCWRRAGHRRKRCWTRRTGAVGKRSRIFTAAPSNVGTYRTAWRAHGRVVARWSFYNNPGD